MKYAVETGSGAMIYIPSFVKIGSGIQKLERPGGINRQHGDRISLLYFSSIHGKASFIHPRNHKFLPLMG
jgi:hypothetical protein